MNRIFVFLIASLAISPIHGKIDKTAFLPEDIITKDVAILGGGASGTYAAVRLREDFNASIIVIEPKNRLGGHVDTYTIPDTNTTIEYGVQSYMRYGPSEAFFKRMGVGIGGPFSSLRSTNIIVDSTNGKLLSDYVPPTTNETNQAIEIWAKLIEKYENHFNPGYWDFFDPKSIPEELLMPFGEFATKYGIVAATPRIASFSGIGVGGLKNVLTLYVVMYFGTPVVRDLLAGRWFAPEGSNSLVYQRAYDLLKSDVLLESIVIEAERSNTGVTLQVESSSGRRQLIEAKRLLVSAQPSLSNLASLGLDTKEEAVFSTWLPTWSFVGVAKLPCVPENASLSFLPPAVAPKNYLAVRDNPWTLSFSSTRLGHFRVSFGTNYTITMSQAKEKIQTEWQRILDAGTLTSTGECNIEWKALGNHNSVEWHQSVEDLKNGFVQKLYGLQGYRGTWYTGSLWCGAYSGNVWAVTDTVLPKLLKSF